MSEGYLGRLARRATGRPLGTQLVPRVDTRVGFGRESDPADAMGDAPAIATSAPRAGESVARRPESGEPAAAIAVRATSVPAAASPGAAPRIPEASAPLAGEPQRSMRTSSPRPTPAVATARGSENAVHPSERPGAAVSSDGDLPGALPSARTGARPLAAIEARTDATLPSRARSAEHGRDGGTQSLDRSQPEANERSAVIAQQAKHAERAAIDSPGRPRMPLQPAARSEAQAAPDATSIQVEIGRIDVRVAPPPPAPPARSRAAPEGFAGYWRLRNYLDRPR